MFVQLTLKLVQGRHIKDTLGGDTVFLVVIWDQSSTFEPQEFLRGLVGSLAIVEFNFLASLVEQTIEIFAVPVSFVPRATGAIRFVQDLVSRSLRPSRS